MSLKVIETRSIGKDQEVVITVPIIEVPPKKVVIFSGGQSAPNMFSVMKKMQEYFRSQIKTRADIFECALAVEMMEVLDMSPSEFLKFINWGELHE